MLLIAIVLFCVFSFFLKGFLSPGNLLTLVRSVSTLGILGVGMAIVVIGRGIDLTIVTIYAMSAAWTLHLANIGVSIPACAGARIPVRARRRGDQRRADRLCRDSRSLRDPGHGRVGLRLRPLRPRPALCGLHARQRRRHRLDRRRLRLRRADADPVFRPRRASSVSRSCVSPSRGGSSMRSATISRRRAFPARRCARSSSCNTRFPRRSLMSPA